MQLDDVQDQLFAECQVGKVQAVQYAREKRIPYLGICYGMQMAVIEFARNVAGLVGANSSEVDPDTPHPVIDLLPEQREIEAKGATMRLGAYPCVLRQDTLAHRTYQQDEVSERIIFRNSCINPSRFSLRSLCPFCAKAVRFFKRSSSIRVGLTRCIWREVKKLKN